MAGLPLKKILGRIEFWILLFFLVRLVGITNPPLETGHNWRQCLTNMMARNFLEGDHNIFYPAIDYAGAQPGYIGSEFPLFNYLIYLISLIFGYTHWYGRLINLIVSGAGVYFFYRLVRNLISERAAFSASIILTVSIWFSYSRKIMPDTFSVSLVIMGLYFGYDYLKNNRMLSLVLFLCLSATGMLCKIPAMSLFSVLLLIPFIREIQLKRKVVLSVAALVAIVLVCLWYFCWVPYLLATYNNSLYFPKGIAEGIREIAPLIIKALEKFYFSSMESYLAFACFIAGLIMLFIDRKKWLYTGIGMIFLVFVVFIIKTGAVFPTHNYYIIPFTPVMALTAGYLLSRIPLRIQYIVLGLITIEAVANQQHDFFLKDSQRIKQKVEEVAAKTTDRYDLIITNGGASPRQIYFAHRKGWTIESDRLDDSLFIDSLYLLGAKYLIVDRSEYEKQLLQYPVKYSDDLYTVYTLQRL